MTAIKLLRMILTLSKKKFKKKVDTGTFAVWYKSRVHAVNALDSLSVLVVNLDNAALK